MEKASWPFSLGELLARIRAASRRQSGLSAPLLTDGGITLDPATPPLPQAISAAEQKVGGTAAKAAYKHKKGQYKVEVVKDTEVYDVIVDANDGTVLSVKKDSED